MTGHYKVQSGFDTPTILVVIMIVAFSAIILAWDIDRPWVGYDSGNNANQSIMARNYLNYGYLKTKFGPVTNVAPATKEEFRYYTHHPVMLPVLLSFSYRMFGTSEAAARLVPVTFTILSLMVWYRVLVIAWPWRTCMFALIFLALMPMTTFYGASTVYESLTLFFVLLIFWFYLLWLESRSMAAYVGMMASTFIGTFSGWDAYLIVPLICLHQLTSRAKYSKQRYVLIGLCLMTFLGFAVFIAHLLVIGGHERLIELSKAFSARSFVDPLPNTPPIATRLGLDIVYGAYLFTPILLVLSGLWFVQFAKKLRRHEPLGRDVFLVLLLGFGLTFVSIFGHGAVHPYMLLNLGPFVAGSAAVAADGILENILNKKRIYYLLCVCLLLVSFVGQSLFHTFYLRGFRQSEDYSNHELGLWIRDNSRPEQKLLVLADRKYRHYVADYYAERDLIFLGPKKAASYLTQRGSEKSPVRYVIAPSTTLANRLSIPFPSAGWPHLDGYECFVVTSDNGFYFTKPDKSGSGVQSVKDPASNLFDEIFKRFKTFIQR